MKTFLEFILSLAAISIVSLILGLFSEHTLLAIIASALIVLTIESITRKK